MKMFNLNRKSNIVCRLIAGLLIASIMVCAFPSIEAEADYGSSTDSVGITVYGQSVSAEVTANADGIAVVNIQSDYSFWDIDITDRGSIEDLEVDTDWTGDTEAAITLSNIPRGTSGTVVAKVYFDDSDALATISISVHGRKLENNCTASARSFTIGDSGTTDYSASEVISVKRGETNLGFSVDTLYKDGANTNNPSLRPLYPGNYSATVIVPETDTYESATKTVSFTVEKYTPSFSIPDVTTGGEPHPSFTIMTDDLATYSYDDSGRVDGMMAGPLFATVYYKGENDSSYTAVKPTAPGTYSAKLMFTDMQESNELNKAASTTFKISLKEGKGTVTVKDTVYGESSVKPEAKSDTNDADKVEFFYKVKNTDDSTYIKDRPTKPGNYVCKAVFPKTGDYDKCEATCIFTIDRGKGVGSLTASDVYVGMEPKTTPTSATNGTTAVKYYYKEKSADSSKYTDKLPTKPGEYTVKAVFPMTDYYYETSAEANFKTSYMPAPTFGLTGKQGKNDFYTDTVSVKAPAGYEVSLSYGKDYKDSINILDGVKYVYFKDKATGALSDKAAVPSYKMDSVLPVVKGVKNNDTIFKDEYELEVTDDYLEMVKVNDQTIPVKDGKATYKLTSDSGEMLYKIEATDQAGHTVTYTITVASPWVKDGFVPAGQIVKLKPGKAYSLKGGKKYKIKGDDTVYNGGSKFYVDKETSLELEEVQ